MKKVLKKIFAVMLVLFAAAAIYFIPLKNTDTEALKSTDTVTVSDNGDVCFFDGPGTDTALIFYPGGKVEYTAYSDLMKRAAELGVDCFVVRMPLNMAFMGVDRAKRIIDENSYDKLFIGGHSLGGVASAMFASDSYDDIYGIVFLASYPSVDLTQTALRTLTVMGDCDGVVNREAFDKGRKLLPENSETVIIEGGNHAQFGTYGEQKGDNEAHISPEEQRQQTAEIIAEFALRECR